MARPRLEIKKKSTSFSLSEEALQLLSLVAQKHNRPSTTNMLEVLISEEAQRLKIKLPKK
jgi:hypothetical protein